MSEASHMALVSDIAANHVETLYRNGSRTLPALTDLLEICQAAVLYDTLAVSPTARKRCRLLRDFDFVYTPSVRVVEAGADSQASGDAEGPADAGRLATPSPVTAGGEPIVIDADDDRGLFSTSVDGDLVLAMAFAEPLPEDRVIGSLADLDALPPGSDYGHRFLTKLPALMVLLQHQRGILKYEDPAARESLEEVFAPLIERYTEYARHVLRLQTTWRVGLVSSVLEQPVVGSLVVDRAISDPDPVPEGERERLVKHLNEALLGAPGRAHFFEQWRFPPVGMMILAEASSLDDVPEVVRQVRGRFAKVRKSIAELESRLGALSRDADGFSADAERAVREREGLERDLQEAYAAFDEEVNHRRTWGRRTELVFNALDYTLAVAKGLGIGTIGTLAELIGLKRMAMMQRIPGLLRMASLVRRADSKLVTETVDRLLGSPPRLSLQADLLGMAYDHAAQYVTHSRDAPPPEMLGIKLAFGDEPPLKLSDREIWMELVRNERLRELLMP